MIEVLNKKHQKEYFDCGKELLTNYLKFQASQDIKRKLAVCFVFSENETNRINGYYTLSNASVGLNSFPEYILNKLPKSNTSIPTTLLGRLTIDKNCQGKGIGKILLIDALKRSYEISHKVGSFAVVVDPIDKEAEDFYKKFDFIKLPDSQKMFIAIKTLEILFKDKT